MTLVATAIFDPGCRLDTLSDQTVHSEGAGTRRAGYQCHSDGNIKIRSGGSFSIFITVEHWQGECANSEYECRLVKTTGNDPIGDALNTYLLCSSVRTWQFVTNGAGKTLVFDGFFDIRRIIDNLVLKTVAVHIHAIDTT